MDRRLACNCALVPLLVLACTAGVTAQGTPPCLLPTCIPASDPAWAGAGQIYQQKQEFVAALRQLSIALTGRFGNEGPRLAAAIDALESALLRWDQSIAVFEKNLQQGGLDADAHTALGTVYLDRYRSDDALRSFQAAARLDTRRADTHQLMAMAHGLANRPAAALAALTRAARLQPDNATIRYDIARYTLTSLPSSPASASAAALAAFQQVAEKQLAQAPTEAPFPRPGLLRQLAGVAPIFPPAPYVQAFELLMKGQFAEAIAECRRAMQSDPLLDARGDGDPLIAGAMALSRGDVPDALKHLGAAVQANSERSEAHRILGVASRLDEQLEQSVEAYKAAIRLRPTDERSPIALADVLTDLGRFSDAEQVLKDTIRLVPATVQAHYRLGRLYQSQGNYPEALKELEYAAQFSPLVGQDPLHEMVALIYATQADFARAIAALRKQIGVNPNNPDAHRRLGDAYTRQDRTAEALAEFTAALLIDRRSLLSYVGIGQIQFRTGNYQAAARAAQSAVQLDPSQKEARYVLSMSLRRLGQADAADRELQEFQRLQAEAAADAQRKYETDGLRREIGVSLAAANYQAAIPLLRQIIAREPDVATHYMTLGAALSRSTQTAEAVEAFELALQRDPLNPDAHLRLAEAYLAAGRADASRREADRYRELIEIAKKQRALRFGNP